MSLSTNIDNAIIFYFGIDYPVKSLFAKLNILITTRQTWNIKTVISFLLWNYKFKFLAVLNIFIFPNSSLHILKPPLWQYNMTLSLALKCNVRTWHGYENCLSSLMLCCVPQEGHKAHNHFPGKQGSKWPLVLLEGSVFFMRPNHTPYILTSRLLISY